MEISVASGGERYVPEELDINSRNAIMHQSRYRWLPSIVNVPNASILDFGCGSGYGSGFLAEQGAQVLGIDISEVAVGYASTKFPLASFRVGDLTDRSLTTRVSQRFDVVVSFDVIEHVEKWWAFLENIRGFLKQGGVAVVGCPNRVAHFDFGLFWNKFHVQEFTPVQLEWATRTQFDEVTVLGQQFLDPAERESHTARPLGPAWHVKEALLQTPLRVPVRNLVNLLHGQQSRNIKHRGPQEFRSTNKIVFEKIDLADEAAVRAPFGLIAICR